MLATSAPTAAGVFKAESVEPRTFTQPTKLFIGGLTRHTTTKQLRDHFSEFGKVLDCVAMRTQDGHPRGFGYVTLECPMAANRCLQQPQSIDGRIVDMKRAVPEGSGVSPSGATGVKAAHFRKNMVSGYSSCDMDMDMYSRQDMQFNEWSAFYGNNAYPWWASCETPTGQSLGNHGLDCLDLLSPHEDCLDLLLPPEASARTPFDSMGLLLPPVLSSEHQATPLLADFQPLELSANAPEFVPAVATPKQLSANAPEFVSTTAPAKAARKAARTNARAPLGELTNIMQVGDLLKPFASPSKKNGTAFGQLSAEDAAAQPESPSAAETAEATCLPKHRLLRSSDLLVHDEGFTILEDKSIEEPKVNPVKEDAAAEAEQRGSAHSQASGSETSDVEGEEALEVDLSLLPSIGSASHAAGECKRCNFFAKGRCQSGKDCLFCHFPHEKRKASRQEKRERRAAWEEQDAIKDTNLAPMQNRKAPAPLDSVGAPPGLLQQPDAAEFSPAAFCFSSMGQTMPGLMDQYAFPPYVSSTPLSVRSFSSATNIFSTVPSPAATAMSTPFPTPLTTPTNAGQDNRMLPGGFSTTTTTSSGTQTGSCMSKSDSKDEKTEHQTVDAINTHKYARDELLRLRAGCNASDRSIPIRSALKTECAV